MKTFSFVDLRFASDHDMQIMKSNANINSNTTIIHVSMMRTCFEIDLSLFSNFPILSSSPILGSRASRVPGLVAVRNSGDAMEPTETPSLLKVAKLRTTISRPSILFGIFQLTFPNIYRRVLSCYRPVLSHRKGFQKKNENCPDGSYSHSFPRRKAANLISSITWPLKLTFQLLTPW